MVLGKHLKVRAHMALAKNKDLKIILVKPVRADVFTL
jgi:hypothetical protein